MKKIILFLLLLINVGYSQIDTANWAFLPNQFDGKFTSLISRELYYGISGGQYKQMSLSATSYDSTVFQLIPNQLDGRYTMIENITTYYGKDSGTVRMTLSDSPLITTETFDTVSFNVLHSRTGNSNIYTTGSDGRNLFITNATNEDSSKIQLSLTGNGGIIVNYYGASILGNSGNPMARDSIMVKFGFNTNYWKYSTAWTTNALNGDPTTGIGVITPNNSDSMVFRGLTSLTSGKYAFYGALYNNKIINTGAVFETKYRTTITQYDTATSSDLMINLDGSTDTVIAVLPLASSNDGLILTYCSIDVTFPVTVIPNGSDLIDGGEVGSLIMEDKYAVRTLKSMNGEWVVIAVTKPGDL